jgi:uncharacterized protein YnzC (UPF0291/DUF896 family)
VDVYGEEPPEGCEFSCLIVYHPDNRKEVLASLGFVADNDKHYWRIQSAELLAEAIEILNKRKPKWDWLSKNEMAASGNSRRKYRTMSQSELEAVIKELEITSEERRDFTPPKFAKGDWRLEKPCWNIILQFQNRKMQLFFYSSRMPSTADVLSCVSFDASSFDSARNFEEWCSELGLNDDSIRAKNTYEEVEKQTAELKIFLGASYDKVLQSEH